MKLFKVIKFMKNNIDINSELIMEENVDETTTSIILTTIVEY